jgi:hypothetical protein
MKFYRSGALLFSATVNEHRIAKQDGFTVCTSEFSNIATAAFVHAQKDKHKGRNFYN